MSNNTTTLHGKRMPPPDGDIELLSQYIDGELAPLEARSLEARLHSEDALRIALVRMQEINQRLRDSLAARAEVPAQIETLLADIADTSADAASKAAATTATGESITNGGSADVLPFPQSRPQSGQYAPAAAAHRSYSWVYALAASFVAAVALSVVVGNQTGVDAGLPGNDALVSAALDTQTSGGDWLELEDGRAIQPVLTFAHHDGNWCREYLLRGKSADWRAVACRNEGQWTTQAASLESYLEPSNAYRPAGVSDAAPVAVFISQHAADIALDIEQETSLINQAWRDSE
ncbi:MAG: hypothetical protein Cons2KO_31590 [Congregibacter sp.]